MYGCGYRQVVVCMWMEKGAYTHQSKDVRQFEAAAAGASTGFKHCFGKLVFP